MSEAPIQCRVRVAKRGLPVQASKTTTRATVQLQQQAAGRLSLESAQNQDIFRLYEVYAFCSEFDVQSVLRLASSRMT